MKAIEHLRSQLEKIGATLDVTDYTLHCDAPSGYVWCANSCRMISIQYASNSQTWLIDAIKREMPCLKMGLEKVIDLKDIAAARWDTGDDTWGAPENSPDRIDWPKN